MMDLVRCVVLVLLLLTGAYCQEMDAENWRNGAEEYKWPKFNAEIIQDILVPMTRKPGPCQSRLMGKKKSVKSQKARKRHKFETFVGLMGKRSFDYQGVL